MTGPIYIPEDDEDEDEPEFPIEVPPIIKPWEPWGEVAADGKDS
jgi:hypothetical protein